MNAAVVACPASWLGALDPLVQPRAKTLDAAEADLSLTAPILAFGPNHREFDADYPRLKAAPFCVFTAVDGPDEVTATAILDALDHLRAQDQLQLGAAHQALAVLRRNYERMADRFGDLEALANDARVGELSTVFAAAPIQGAWLTPRPGRWVQPLAGDARDYNCAAFYIAGETLNGRAVLLRRGSGADLAQWTLTPDAIRGGVVRLAWPRQWESGGLALAFEWPSKPPPLAAFAVAAPHPTPEFCVSVDGASQPRPLAMALHLARPTGAIPAGALWPDGAGPAPARRLLTPETLATVRLVSPRKANPKLASVGADSHVTVHPMAGADVVAVIDLGGPVRGRLWGRLRNDHPQNDGVEMRLGVAPSASQWEAAVFTPWARLGPLEATLAHINAVDAGAIVICSRLLPNGSDRNAWARVSGLALD